MPQAPIRNCVARCSEVTEGPPFISVTRNTKAFQQYSINDEASPAVQQASLTSLVDVRILADDLCFVLTDLARLLEGSIREMWTKTTFTAYNIIYQSSTKKRVPMYGGAVLGTVPYRFKSQEPVFG